MNKLSIITVNYNNREGLINTILSVQSQSCKDFEYIVIDGASTDGSKEYLEQNSSSISYWISEPDNGIYHAMNKGVAKSTGEYCLFINSGDTLHDDGTIEMLLPFLSTEDFIIGRIKFLNTGEESLSDYPLTMNWFYSGSIPHPATCIKREWLERFPYDESLKIVSDWKFFIQCIIQNNASYKMADVVISDFEAGGISGRNISLVEKERSVVLSQLFPQRVLIDYYHFQNGVGYQNDIYDHFFIKLHEHKYYRIIYLIDNILLRIMALFKKSARFVYDFPRKIS